MELVVVVLVVAITAALVGPRIGKADTSRLRAAAQMLAADLQVAQFESMAHPDEPRMLDWHIGEAWRYNLETSDRDGAPDPGRILTHPMNKGDYQVYFGQNAAYHFLDGVWLAKSNLSITDHNGHIHFGAYGHVELPAYTPTMILAAGDRTLEVAVQPDTGAVQVADDFGLLSAINAATLPGPAGNVHTQATPPY